VLYPPGRDTDALIAEQVYRYAQRHLHTRQTAPLLSASVAPHYTTDIGDAWLLVELLELDRYAVTLSRTTAPVAERWTCKVVAEGRVVEATAPTGPLAISRAVLSLLRAEAGR
jgi:hypothetical protein